MSRNARIFISTVIATASLLIILAGVAFAKAPEADNGSVTNNTTWATSAVTPTTDAYTPKTITEFGTYTFTYPIVLHNDDPTITPTVRLTVTLDPLLSFDPEGGTLVLPGGTILFPGSHTIVWTPILTYCQPATLTVTAKGVFDQGTLDLGINRVTTRVEWDGNSHDLVTHLILYRIYLPLVMKNY